MQITNHVGSQYVCAWIDLDDSYTFNADERLISNAAMPGSNQTFTFDLPIPESATPGQHRLRIRTAWNVNPSDPCATYNYGETEDYTVILVAGVQNGTIAGIITDSDSGLPLEGASMADESGFHTTTSGADGYYQLSNLPPGTYILNVSKTGYATFTSDETVVSAGATTTLNVSLTQESDYCTTNLYSVGCSFGDYLDDFVFADIQNLNSGCSPNSYGDFTTLTANVEAGFSYTIQASSGYSYQRLSIWIDMNDDQVFDVSEKVLADLNLANAGTTYSAELIIPAGAVPGIHRLRARTNYGSSCSSPCDTYIYGEVEDYTVAISVAQTVTQEIFIQEGWSGISTYLVPEAPAIQTILQEIVDEIIIVQNGTGVYWPSQQINTIGNWNYNVGYKVKSTIDVVLNITGVPIIPAQVNLYAGWNIMPVISECIVNTEELLAGETGNLVVMKEVAGTGVYWPSFGINTLPVLSPGKSYYINVSNSVTLNFMGCLDKSVTGVQRISKPDSPWNEITYTPTTHQVGIPARLGNVFEINSIVGAFTTENLCAGFAVLDGKNSTITLFGDDPLTLEKDGFMEGEPITFKMKKNDYQVEITAVFDASYPQNDGTFQQNGISVIEKIVTDVQRVNSDNSLNPVIFPNPAQDFVTVKTSLPVTKVIITDITGCIVLERNVDDETFFTIDLGHLANGLYSLTLIGKDFRSSQKITKTNVK